MMVLFHIKSLREQFCLFIKDSIIVISARKIVVVTLVFLSGIWYGIYKETVWYNIWIVAFILGIISFAFSFNRRLFVTADVLFLLAVFLGGWSAVSLEKDIVEVPVLLKSVREPVEIIGKIVSDVEISDIDGSMVYYFDFMIKEYKKSKIFKCYGAPIVKARIKSCKVNILPTYGEEWYIKGYLVEISPYQFFLNSRIEYCSRVKEANHTLLSILFSFRRKALNLLETGISDYPEVSGLLKSLILGYRAGLRKDIKDLFIGSGTLHIFAVSGLHVGVVALFVSTILGLFYIQRFNWPFFLIPSLIFYTLITGTRASAVRACVMFVLYYFAPLIKRRSDIISSIATAGLLQLGYNPVVIVDPGFVLSFVVVMGIVIIVPLLHKFWDCFIRRDDFVMEHYETAFFRYMKDLLAVSTIAWLISTPLISRFFGRITFMPLFSNLIVIPLATLSMVCGVMSIITGMIDIHFAEVFNNAALVIIKVKLFILHILHNRIEEYLTFYVNISCLYVVMYYVCIIFAITIISFFIKRFTLLKEKEFSIYKIT